MTDDTPLVTIITAVFNGVDQIERALSSVAAQSYKNIEHIVIDGGSTDGTKELLERNRGKLAVLISEPDNGIGDAWNKGLRRATGEIIGILNADDYYDPAAIAEVVKVSLSITSPAIYYGSVTYIDNSGIPFRTIDRVFSPRMLMLGPQIIHTSVFVDRKIYDNVGYFDDRLNIAVDADFLLRAHCSGSLFVKANNRTFMQIGGVSERKVFKGYWEYTRILRKLRLYTTAQIWVFRFFSLFFLVALKLRHSRFLIYIAKNIRSVQKENKTENL